MGAAIIFYGIRNKPNKTNNGVLIVWILVFVSITKGMVFKLRAINGAELATRPQ